MADKFFADSGTVDSDGDKLSDEFEINVLGTKPNERHSDGDGLDDNRELDCATDPMDPDSDHVGLTDYCEVIVGTNPHSPDSDGDKVGDRDEVRPERGDRHRRSGPADRLQRPAATEDLDTL